MEAIIKEKLKELEQEENVKILLAVESGSRAWGFPSPNSDYDVRFVYVRPQKEYLRLDRGRDVIERPICDELDINGWDLDKTLKLLHAANPTVFEWFSSPIIYKETEFGAPFRERIGKYFSAKRSLYHYLSMAESNNREFLKGDLVKAKKYFYVLRPILACRWVLEKGCPPPMLFRHLVEDQLDAEIRPEVERLLEQKMVLPELKEIKRIERVNDYIETQLAEIRGRIATLPDSPPPAWDELNEILLAESGRLI